jgi:hypothetical protein
MTGELHRVVDTLLIGHFPRVDQNTP